MEQQKPKLNSLEARIAARRLLTNQNRPPNFLIVFSEPALSDTATGEIVDIVEAEPGVAIIGGRTIVRHAWESAEEFKQRVRSELPARGGAIAVLRPAEKPPSGLQPEGLDF